MSKETVTVNTRTVSCEGNGPVTGHPKVYLTFQPGSKEIVCPYCSRTFVLSPDAPVSAHH